MTEQHDIQGASSDATAPTAESSSQAAAALAPQDASANTDANVNNSQAEGSSSPAAPSISSQTTSNVPQPTIYLPPSSSSNVSGSSTSKAQTVQSSVIPPLPSEEIKPTTEELQALYASTVEKNYRMGINPNAPLMTKAMREREQAKRSGGQSGRKTYSEIKIRFRLPDRTTVEYNLPSSRRLLSLYPLFTSTLASPIPFILYTSPPKVEYKQDDTKLKDKTLADMGWGGAAVVQVKFTGTQDITRKVLKAELLEQAKTLEPPKMGIQEQDPKAATPSTSSSSAGRTLGGGPVPPSENKEKKVPKWFKGFKK